MKKVYLNPETICTLVQMHTIICVSADVQGGSDQSNFTAPQRGVNIDIRYV